MRETARLPDAGRLVEAVTSRLRAAPGAVFQVTTHSGCLVCARLDLNGMAGAWASGLVQRGKDRL